MNVYTYILCICVGYTHLPAHILLVSKRISNKPLGALLIDNYWDGVFATYYNKVIVSFSIFKVKGDSEFLNFELVHLFKCFLFAI